MTPENEIKALKEELEHERVRLAGCSVVAHGNMISEQTCAKRGDYGWSPAYQDVLELRRAYEETALRLAAIEAAGDEEVEKACEALRRGYWTSEDGDSIRPDRHIDAVLDVVASRNATIADLRAKLGEAEKAAEEMENQYTEVLINTRNLAVQKSEAQSAEIAGLRDLLKGVIEFADSGDFDGAISLALYRRIQSAIGVELPNPSEIPNSSEVSDAAEGG